MNDYKNSSNAVNSPVKKVHRVDLKSKGIARSNSGSLEGRNHQLPMPGDQNHRQITIEHSGKMLMEPTSKQSDKRISGQNSFIRELGGSDAKFSGISGIARKKTTHQSEF